ncbi:acyl carrier protein [Herbaspirillum sp. RTI4]|uniref:acyl carrier protein n=1 Tax=Herbaspirillum sp. RTI4 TaxID=3048640 RepID=UPI002AB47AA8|nr:acyl carrier protein [Herbaspirillum sp. RTI4]MDY7578933.1 acyl carrier protein [Herbaspirillum sp. RTI4]MEA9982022.1 acyl carrier protein [Herbaspirillum sp. RTI4]
MTTLLNVHDMNRDQLYLWIVDMLHDMFEIDKTNIQLESNLYADLDIDSIDAVDIVVKLSQSTGKRLQPEVFRSVRTVQDIVNVIETLKADEKA